MKIGKQHIFVALATILVFFASCSRDRAKVIPRNKMAKIYAEMLVTDQWIMTTPSVRRIADTSLVYEPILEKYGYDSDDYRKSVDKYMDDPERFARILRNAGDILGVKIRELEEEQKRIQALAKLPKIKYEFKFEELAPCMAHESYTHYYDSVAVVRDSAMYSYRITSIERGDTLYDGLRMIVKNVDSLKVDSLKKEPLKTGNVDLKPLKSRESKDEVLKVDAKEFKLPELTESLR